MWTHKHVDSCCFSTGRFVDLKKPGPVRCWWALWRLRAAGLPPNLTWFIDGLFFKVGVSTYTNARDFSVYTTILEFPGVWKTWDWSIRTKMNQQVEHVAGTSYQLQDGSCAPSGIGSWSSTSSGRKNKLLRIAIMKGMTSPPIKRLLTMDHGTSPYIFYICMNDTQLVHNVKAFTPSLFFSHTRRHAFKTSQSWWLSLVGAHEIRPAAPKCKYVCKQWVVSKNPVLASLKGWVHPWGEIHDKVQLWLAAFFWEHLLRGL